MSIDNAINLTFVLLSLGRPALIIVAVAQYIVRRSPFLCRGFWLLLGCPEPGYILSSCLPGLQLTESGDDQPVSVPETQSETAEIPQPVAENQSEIVSLEIEPLARLVAAGKLGITDAVKIGCGAKSGERYQKYSRDLQARIKILQGYPDLTPEQKELRARLQLGAKQ